MREARTSARAPGRRRNASRRGANRCECRAALVLGGRARADELESEECQAAEPGDEENDHR